MGILQEDDDLVEAALSDILSLPIHNRLQLDTGRDVSSLTLQQQLNKVNCSAFMQAND